MKFVRWIGAFGKGPDLVSAGQWEIRQTNRQVATEPLWRSRSLIDHAKVGLVIDHEASIFAAGWIRDAWTKDDDQGVLRSRSQRRFKDIDRFLAAWNRSAGDHHAEAAFDAPVFSAVVVKSSARSRGHRRARKLAATLALPLVTLK